MSEVEEKVLGFSDVVLTVDLVEKDCSECSVESYPSILVDWGGIKFVCAECLSDILGVSISDVETYLGVQVMHKSKSVYLDLDWVKEGEIAEMIDVFKVIEDEDRQHVEFEGLQVVTRFLSGLDKGLIFYTKDEIIDYLNFYGNDIELVLTLRSKFYEEPDNEFIKDVYISARTKTLTEHQIRALTRDRRYSFMFNDDIFWDRLEDLYVEVDLQSISQTGLGKLRGVITDVLETGRYTDKQYAYLLSQMDRFGV